MMTMNMILAGLCFAVTLAEDEIQEDDEDEVVRSISEALKKNEDDLEVLDIQDVDDVDDVKRT